MDLPLYKSHKTVRAARILRTLVDCDALPSVRKLTLDGGHKFEAPVSDPIWARFVPTAGDYYVVYEDGYISFSPMKAFEEGYSLAS